MFKFFIILPETSPRKQCSRQHIVRAREDDNTPTLHHEFKTISTCGEETTHETNSRTTSRVDALRKVFEEKSLDDCKCFNNNRKRRRLRRNVRRHTISGVSFQEEVELVADDDSEEIVDQVIFFLYMDVFLLMI